MGIDNAQNKQLMEEVNPVFTTAQACLLVMAEAGDPEAEQLVYQLGFDRGIASVDKDALTNMEKFQRMKAIPGFTTMIEARFAASTNLIRSRQERNIVDLPCGYTPRGLQFAKSSYAYYGLDLPPVTEAMNRACSELHREEELQLYHAVDATNYDSLRSVLQDVHGELFITMEGLLMYLTQSELEEVFCNISRLLEEFGGIWVTTDNMIAGTQEKVVHAICPEQKQSVPLMKAPEPENAFFDPQRAESFIRGMGFTLEKVAVYDFLPDQLYTLSKYPEEIQKKARNAFRDMYFWMMRLSSDSVKKHFDHNHQFQVRSRRAGHKLLISLQGRLDTLTAPEFLKWYRRENEREASDSIDIDIKDLDYISSAGLRVLLIMLKDRPKDGTVTVHNPNMTVRAIIETSGFDQLLY